MILYRERYLERSDQEITIQVEAEFTHEEKPTYYESHGRMPSDGADATMTILNVTCEGQEIELTPEEREYVIRGLWDDIQERWSE